MNCKPGDLARVVAPYAKPGRGAFVVVRRRARPYECLDGNVFQACNSNGGWVCDGWVRDSDGGVCGPQLAIADECLRPIRDNDGEDQTLTWAGKPSDIKTPEAA
jgi:hypothetical protein